MKKVLFSLLFAVAIFNAQAQSKSDILNSDKPITWLGMDFTQVKFIGSAAQWKDAGEVTNSQMRDKYFPAWNDLFEKEKEKYKVADAVNRTDVQYAIDVTEKANNSASGNFFAEDGNAYQLLDEKKIGDMVKKYDFKGHKGIGMMYFVEGMSKGKEEASMWVTFVDMGTKKVLVTKRVEGKAGGFGFRNYWAKSFLSALKTTKKDLDNW